MIAMDAVCQVMLLGDHCRFNKALHNYRLIFDIGSFSINYQETDRLAYIMIKPLSTYLSQEGCTWIILSSSPSINNSRVTAKC